MKPTPSDTWVSPTMLSPEEIESLREENARDMEWIRAVLAQRRAAKQAQGSTTPTEQPTPPPAAGL